MPIYEYGCAECGHFFEKLMFSREKDEEVQCPECGAKHAERRMSAPVVSSKNESSFCSPSPSTGFS